jgi:cyclopropane-fatty-acyl-phospholipid synthase
MENINKLISKILLEADIKLNGKRPWDIRILNNDLFRRVISRGLVGAGEAYMDGWWECNAIDEMIFRITNKNLKSYIKKYPKIILSALMTKIFNFQGKSKAFNVAKRHYNISNILFENMLDKRLVYTCGYWKNASNLDEAQENKLDLVCRKIGLKPGDKVLDIGSGWGSFAKFASEKYKAKVTGITVSKEQVELGKKLCKGLPVKIYLKDYRDISETDKFDHIVSLGMFEHVGYKNYRSFVQIVSKHLKETGLFLLHTIGGNHSVTNTNPWIDKYIFPGGMLPSISQIGSAIENLFVMEDWHNFGADYDKTLMAWFKNFNKNWQKIKSVTNLDERFYRMWKLYLLSCAGSFRARNLQLWQIVLSKKGIKDGYKSVRS